jgi:hypothetical protein
MDCRRACPRSEGAELQIVRELALDHDALIAAVCQCQPESMPAGNFCKISEAPVFGLVTGFSKDLGPGWHVRTYPPLPKQRR